MAEQPNMRQMRPNAPKINEKEILNHVNPVANEDAEVYQAEDFRALPVRVFGPVMVQQMPTVSAGSRTETLQASGRALRIASADPRRASVTILTNQPTYVSSSIAQVELGTAALVPANVGVVISHRGEIYVAGPAANTYPMTVAVLVENWAY